MATINYTVTREGKWWKVFWETLTESDTCQVLRIGDNISDAWFHVTGTFGGATVVLNGGQDETPDVNLDDPGDTAISLTAAGGSPVRDLTTFVQPSASGGSSQDVDITLWLKVV